MIKAFIPYLLLLCILLPGGYRPLSIHAHNERSFYPLIKTSRDTESVSVDTAYHGKAFNTKSSSSGTEKNFDRQATQIEEKEEESFPSRKYLVSSHYFSTVFCAHILAYFFRYNNKSLLSGKHFSHSLSYRWHLIIQVFRI